MDVCSAAVFAACLGFDDSFCYAYEVSKGKFETEFPPHISKRCKSEDMADCLTPSLIVVLVIRCE